MFTLSVHPIHILCIALTDVLHISEREKERHKERMRERKRHKERMRERERDKERMRKTIVGFLTKCIANFKLILRNSAKQKNQKSCAVPSTVVGVHTEYKHLQNRCDISENSLNAMVKRCVFSLDLKVVSTSFKFSQLHDSQSEQLDRQDSAVLVLRGIPNPGRPKTPGF